MIRILSIEGNIGAGKSTLMEEIKKKYADNDKVHFLDEPVELWENVKDKFGVSMLQKYYSNPSKYSFAFQMMAYTSRIKILRKMEAKLLEEVKDGMDRVIITERSILTDKYVFAQMLYDEGKMEDVEFQIYNEMFEEFSTRAVDMVVMLETTPEISFERVVKRGRVGEVIPLEYLEKCFRYHESMLQYMNRTVFDANQDIYENPELLASWLQTIDDLIVRMSDPNFIPSSIISII
uniref:Deoxynucleoside kinase domain-containing protein n=1 Tax=viral metagenome TaxID=1070528 RepID=A0A6C0HS16_9ZZZZ